MLEFDPGVDWRDMQQQTAAQPLIFPLRKITRYLQIKGKTSCYQPEGEKLRAAGADRGAARVEQRCNPALMSSTCSPSKGVRVVPDSIRAVRGRTM